MSIQAQNPLQKNFQTPPNTAKPRIWWHWDYSETFKEVLEREKRALAQKQVDAWREKMRTPNFNHQFEPFESQENDDYYQETTHPLEG